MARPEKPIHHGDKKFTSLKAMADHYGVVSTAICGKIKRGHWRGEKLYYAHDARNATVNRVYIAHNQFTWLDNQAGEGESASDVLARVLGHAILTTVEG